MAYRSRRGTARRAGSGYSRGRRYGSRRSGVRGSRRTTTRRSTGARTVRIEVVQAQPSAVANMSVDAVRRPTKARF